jgi:hypothetical protein
MWSLESAPHSMGGYAPDREAKKRVRGLEAPELLVLRSRPVWARGWV